LFDISENKVHILQITLKLDLYINYRNAVFDAESLPKKNKNNLSTIKAKKPDFKPINIFNNPDFLRID